MKKLLFVIGLLTSVFLTAQTMVFSVQELKVKPFTQKDIASAFDDVFDGVKMNQAGVVLERFRKGSSNGMTHRLVFMSTLGVDMIDEDAIGADKNAVFWGKLRNYVEEWGAGYSGRILSWQEAALEGNKNIHIWDIKVKDQNNFKAGHDKIIREFKSDFDGRVVGFGTYDIGRPNGATHWIVLSGKNTNDHLMLYDKLEKDNKFLKLIEERGDFEDVKDYELRTLRRKQ